MYPVRLRYGKNGSRKYVDKANQYMAAMGLQSFAKHYPYQLSGGMQQRAAIARALMCEPRVLLMDEPFGGLDAQTKIVMQELVRELWALYKTTIFFITHDVDEAILLGHKCGVMSSRPGKIVLQQDVPFDDARSSELMTTPLFMETKRSLLAEIQKQSRMQMTIDERVV